MDHAQFSGSAAQTILNSAVRSNGFASGSDAAEYNRSDRRLLLRGVLIITALYAMMS
jgi:hypothetical protein